MSEPKEKLFLLPIQHIKKLYIWGKKLPITWADKLDPAMSSQSSKYKNTPRYHLVHFSVIW